MTSTVEDGKLKIKTVSEPPEIRNLSDQSNHHDPERGGQAGAVSGSESDDGSESKNSVDRTNATDDVVTTSKDNTKQQQQNSKQLSNNCTLMCQAQRTFLLNGS